MSYHCSATLESWAPKCARWRSCAPPGRAACADAVAQNANATAAATLTMRVSKRGRAARRSRASAGSRVAATVWFDMKVVLSMQVALAQREGPMSARAPRNPCGRGRRRDYARLTERTGTSTPAVHRPPEPAGEPPPRNRSRLTRDLTKLIELVRISKCDACLHIRRRRAHLAAVDVPRRRTDPVSRPRRPRRSAQSRRSTRHRHRSPQHVAPEASSNHRTHDYADSDSGTRVSSRYTEGPSLPASRRWAQGTPTRRSLLRCGKPSV